MIFEGLLSIPSRNLAAVSVAELGFYATLQMSRICGSFDSGMGSLLQ